MKSYFDTMKKALHSTSLYEVDYNYLWYELMTYASEIDTINADIIDMLNECFINTASSYGLSNRELVIGALRDDLDIEKRREMLTLRERIDTSCFTVPKIKQALESFGLEFELIEYPSLYTVVVDTIGHYDKKQQTWIRNEVRKIMPAHLSVDVIFNGLRWQTIDLKNNTFSYMDSLFMTWKEIDNL